MARRWEMALGRWELALGRWEMALGRWELALGRWEMAFGRRPAHNRLRRLQSIHVCQSQSTHLPNGHRLRSHRKLPCHRRRRRHLCLRSRRHVRLPAPSRHSSLLVMRGGSQAALDTTLELGPEGIVLELQLMQALGLRRLLRWRDPKGWPLGSDGWAVEDLGDLMGLTDG